MKVRIEEIDGDDAVLRPILHLVGKQAESLRIPAEFLPDGHGKGDTIELAFLPDPQRRTTLQREVKQMIAELTSKQASQNGPLTEQSLAACLEIALRRQARSTSRGFVLQDLTKASQTIAKALWAKISL